MDGPGSSPSPKYGVSTSYRKLKASLVLYDLHARTRVWEGLALTPMKRSRFVTIKKRSRAEFRVSF